MNYKLKSILVRYGVSSVGLFLVAIGVALSIISNLGTAPLSCMAYLFNLKWPGISVGTFTLIVNMSYILIQLALLRKRFEARFLMQIVASALFGYMIDLSMQIFAWLQPLHFADRVVLGVFASAVTALGTSLEVVANAWMLSAEMTVSALSTVTKAPFERMKVIMDSTIVLLSMGLNLLLFNNLLGGNYSSLLNVLLAKDEGVVIGLGTLMLAILPGVMMKLSNVPAKKLMDFIKRKTGLDQ